MDREAQLKALKGSPEPLTLDGLVEYNQKVLLPAIEQSMDKRFEKVVTKPEHRELTGEVSELNSEFKEFKGQSLKGQDEMLTILRRLDEERVTADSWLERLDKDVERLKEKVGLKGA